MGLNPDSRIRYEQPLRTLSYPVESINKLYSEKKLPQVRIIPNVMRVCAFETKGVDIDEILGYNNGQDSGQTHKKNTIHDTKTPLKVEEPARKERNKKDDIENAEK